MALPKLTCDDEADIPNLISKWKSLTHLQFESKPSNFSEVAAAISRNCKDFQELAIPSSSIKKEDASAIATYLPKLRSLDLSRSFVSKAELMAVVEGCGELARLSARDCVGFEADDEEIVGRGRGIRVLEVEGSKVEDDGGYETDECDERYVHVI